MLMKANIFDFYTYLSARFLKMVNEIFTIILKIFGTEYRVHILVRFKCTVG